MKMIQYQIWNHCSNHCLFCSQQGSKDKNKIENLIKIERLLDNDEVFKYDTIGLIGGEIFDFKFNEEIRERFYILIDKIKGFILDKKHPINNLFIMTNLIYDRNLELNNFLNKIQEIKEQVVFCTSWDIKGRFHNENSLKLFDDNFSFLKKRNYKLHIEIILTGSFLENILDNKLSFKELQNKYIDNIDFIAPHNGRHSNFESFDNFFPKRSIFMKFLEKEILLLKEINPERFLNRSNHSNIVYDLDMEGNLMKTEERIRTIGSMPQDACINYSDDDKHHMYTDFINFKEMFNL